MRWAMGDNSGHTCQIRLNVEVDLDFAHLHIQNMINICLLHPVPKKKKKNEKKIIIAMYPTQQKLGDKRVTSPQKVTVQTVNAVVRRDCVTGRYERLANYLASIDKPTPERVPQVLR